MRLHVARKDGRLLEVGGLAMLEALFRVEGLEADLGSCEGIGVPFRGVEGLRWY